MRVYLDHAATTPLRPEAREAWLAATELVGNPSSIHGGGQDARRLLEESRERLAAVARTATRSRSSSPPAAPSRSTSRSRGCGGRRRAHGSAAHADRRARRPSTTPPSTPSSGCDAHEGADSSGCRWTRSRGCDLDGVARRPSPHRGCRAGDAPGGEQRGRHPPARSRAGRGRARPPRVPAAPRCGRRVRPPAAVDSASCAARPVRAASGLVAMSVVRAQGRRPGRASARSWSPRDAELQPLLHGGGQQRGLALRHTGRRRCCGVRRRRRTRRGGARRRGGAPRARCATGWSRGIRRGRPGGRAARRPGRPAARQRARPVPRARRGTSLLFLLDRAGVAVSTGSACQAGVARAVARRAGDGPRCRGRPQRAAADARAAPRPTRDVDAVLAALPRRRMPRARWHPGAALQAPRTLVDWDHACSGGHERRSGLRGRCRARRRRRARCRRRAPRALPRRRHAAHRQPRLLHHRGRDGRPARRRSPRHPVLRVGLLRALPRRRHRRTSSPSTRPAARPTPACAATRRSSSPRCWRGDRARLRRRLHRALRDARRRATAVSSCTGHRRRQGPVLRARRAHRRAARPHLLPARARRRPRRSCAPRPSRARAHRRAEARQPRHLLHPRRRHPRLARRQGRRRARARSSTARAPSSARTRARTPSPSASVADCTLGVPASDGKPRFVLEVRPISNTVVVGPKEALATAEISGDAVHLGRARTPQPPSSPATCRSAPTPTRCLRTARLDDGIRIIVVTPEHPARRRRPRPDRGALRRHAGARASSRSIARSPRSRVDGLSPSSATVGGRLSRLAE